MPRAYSPDLRARVLAASQDDRLSHRAVAARFRVGESTVRLWLRRVRATGVAVLEALVEERAERTLAEWADGYRERTGVALSTDAVWRACRRLDLRRKKQEPARDRADARRRGGRA